MKQKLFTIALLLSAQCHAQLLHGDMESWRDYHVITAPSVTLESPAGWYSPDSIIFYSQGLFTSASFSQQVYKVPDAHTGSYAAKLVTLAQDTMGILPALLSNAHVNVDLSLFSPSNPTSGIVFSGGTPVTSHINQLNAWVKYYPNGNDTAFIRAYVLHTSGVVTDTVGKGVTAIYNGYAVYTMIGLPILYDTSLSPNLLQIFISSSGKSPKDSSTLFVDDISIDNVSVKELNMRHTTLFPNPAKETLHIECISCEGLYLKLYNIAGQSVLRQPVPANGTINIGMLEAGSYVYHITDEHGNCIDNGKIEVQ